LLVYTVTNLTTKKVYVGTTASTAESKWAHLIEAAEQGFDYPLYEEIREMGQGNFLVEEWADGVSKEETQALELEAMTTFHGESIKGYKLLPRMPSRKKKAKSKPPPPMIPEEIDALSDDIDLAPLNDEFSMSGLEADDFDSQEEGPSDPPSSETPAKVPPKPTMN